MTEDDTETATFSVMDVERVLGCGELVGLAIVELTLQGIKIRRLAGDRITIMLPDFRHLRTDRMCTAIILPRELSDTIGVTVTSAFNTLGYSTLAHDPSRGVTGLATMF